MSDPIEGADFFVRLVPFPTEKCGGVITPNDDGTYSIYINSRLDRKRQRKAADHELGHIKGDDFADGKEIEQIEQI